MDRIQPKVKSERRAIETLKNALDDLRDVKIQVSKAREIQKGIRSSIHAEEAARLKDITVHRNEVASLEAERINLLSDLTEIRNSYEYYSDLVFNSNREVDALIDDLNDLESEISDIKEAKNRITETLSQKKKLNERVNELKGERNEYGQQSKVLKAEVLELAGQREILISENSVLSKEIARAKKYKDRAPEKEGAEWSKI